ncbi:DEAD/DEAH box helicase [Alkalinema pantanalense CENA528]|uniref:DEAD/DEAH box helicase n=1 Tax=Alkalinema pantanalense TaxID=1620705 RepID=UPI003D6E9185
MSTSLQHFGIDPEKVFPFALDGFQQEAIRALDAGESVVVCAPTGSGKTLIGEYAIYRALARNRRVFYTTPLKALSNQKFRDFREEFGQDQVGLLTGDISINRDAPIVVMTTEIFRNMLYGTPIGEVGVSLIGVEAVVLDECHYMNDSQRGTVWEESIIYCPAAIQIVALSATVANSEQLTDWINQIHGTTRRIYSDFRPVPLQFFFANPNGVFPLLDDTGKRLNPRLRPKGGRQRPRGANQRGAKRAEPPALAFTIGKLRHYDMLPAIYFIFSRKGCDRAVEELGDLTLVTPEESARIKAHLDELIARAPEAVREKQVAPLLRGIAAHHAGILPAWKVLVEELFQQGLIKVVFATETLAAGINMPARTTVISSLSKRTDAGHRLLNASEFLQMAGRAGRRGMDEKGYVVTVQSPYEGAREAAYLATSGADPLVSQFTPTYGMVLNLLQTHSLEQAKELVERSFAQYLATLVLRPQQSEIDRLEADLELLRETVASVDWKLLNQYEKLQERLREERRLLKTLQQQAARDRAEELSMTLAYALSGSILTLKGEHLKIGAPMGAVLVSKIQGSGQFPYLLCLTETNRWAVVSLADVVTLRTDLPRIEAVDRLAPPDPPPKLGQMRKGDEITAKIASQIVEPEDEEILPPEVYAQLQRMQAVQTQRDEHPVHEWGDRAKVLKFQQRIESLEEELRDRREKMGRHVQRHWEEFLSLISILQHFGALEGVTPTVLGQATAAIRGENELWLGLAVMSGELNDLDPHHLATVCAGLVTDVSRPDSWVRYGLSEAVAEALGALRSTRRQLFQQQRRHGIMLPVWLEDDLVALIEQWALGAEWSDLCANTSLDEGDVVRMLRRTLDLLSQIPHVPHASSSLVANALRAKQLIDRFPVSEDLE